MAHANGDVLLDIMRHLTKANLASAALVCRRWLPQARGELYHELYFDTNAPHAPCLSATMRSNEFLRSLLRRLHISHCVSSQGSPTLLDWIALLPEHSLQLLESRRLIFDKAAATSVPITEYPAVRTLPHLFLRTPRFLDMQRLNQVLHFQHLEILSIEIDQSSEVPSLPDCCMPRLRRLSLEIFEYGATVSRILGGVTVSLERFDLHAVSLCPQDIARLAGDLQRHLPALKSASFDFHWPPASPFLDELVPSMKCLETLCCGVETYTKHLMAQLPETLVSLTLCASPEAFPGDEYAELVKHYTPPGLTKFIIANKSQSEASKALAEVCNERHITLEIVKWGSLDFCA